VLLGVGLLTQARSAQYETERYHHLYIAFTNDMHGSLVPSEGFWMNPDFPPPVGNGPAATTVISELRAEAAKKGYGFLYVDLGDMFSGTPLGEFTKGQALIDFLNYNGCDLHVPGNHDFDLGESLFVELVKRSRSPFLCANIVKQGTDSLWPVMMPDTIIELSGVKLGFFGLLTHYMKMSASEQSFGGLDVVKHYTAAQREIEKLHARGADVIIALTHIGYSHDRNVADSIPGIDVIIGGHSHTGLNQMVETPRYHTAIAQTYGRLSTVGLVDLTFDMATRRLSAYNGDLIELSGDEIDPDTTMSRMVEEWRVQAEAGFDRVIGTARRKITRSGPDESAMGNLITDAMREAYQGDVALHVGVRGELPQGELTYRDAYKSEPFGNTVVTMTMTGKQLQDVLEMSVNGHHAIFQVSGIKMTYDPRQPIGKRLLSAEIGGKAIEPEREYRVIASSYLAAGVGEYGVFTQGKDIEDTYTTIRDVLAAYIAKHSPIDTRIGGRILSSSK
jgi:2',3'-cyclic-nucleotide 2'-phosphodiesterase (5'-nucleotidase family)